MRQFAECKTHDLDMHEFSVITLYFLFFQPEPERPSIPRPTIPILKPIPGLMELETYDATAFIPVLPQITGESFKMNNDY